MMGIGSLNYYVCSSESTSSDPNRQVILRCESRCCQLCNTVGLLRTDQPESVCRSCHSAHARSNCPNNIASLLLTMCIVLIIFLLFYLQIAKLKAQSLKSQTVSTLRGDCFVLFATSFEFYVSLSLSYPVFRFLFSCI